MLRTGAHELHHATDPLDVSKRKAGEKLNSKEHQNAKDVGTKAAKEFGKLNNEKKEDKEK